MLLSAAEMRSGVLPGAFPARVRIDAAGLRRVRQGNHWRRFQLGDVFTPELITVTPEVTIPSTDTFSPQFISVTPEQTFPTFITPSAPDIPMPSFTIADQPPANPVPTTATPSTSGSTDYFGDALKLLSVAGQTLIGYTAAQHGALPPGVSGGIFAGQPVTGLPGGITAAQLALMTPAQRAQYASMYPGTAAGSTPTDFLSALMGGSSGTTMLLLGGASLLVMVMLMRK
jgi:hypothetical protein